MYCSGCGVCVNGCLSLHYTIVLCRYKYMVNPQVAGIEAITRLMLKRRVIDDNNSKRKQMIGMIHH